MSCRVSISSNFGTGEGATIDEAMQEVIAKTLPPGTLFTFSNEPNAIGSSRKYIEAWDERSGLTMRVTLHPNAPSSHAIPDLLEACERYRKRISSYERAWASVPGPGEWWRE